MMSETVYSYASMNEPYAKKRFLIKFGDNDFGNTMMAFADVMAREKVHQFKEGWLTKTKIAELWNMGAPFLYLVAQNAGRYDSPNTAKYLQITESKVYLDDEALDYIDKNQRDWNGEWILVNLDGSPYVLI